jgi:hypothetical protein
MVKYQKSLLALALAVSVGSVYAQSTGGDAGGQGGGNTASANTFQSWLNTHSDKNDGRISRRAYMSEAGRRWDSMDHNKRGLTTDQIYSMYSPGAVMGGPTPSTPNEKKGVQN